MNEVNELLARVGGWKSVAFVAALVIVFSIVKRLLAKAPVDPNVRRVSCVCGWSGSVSRLKPRCPKCGRGDALTDA